MKDLTFSTALEAAKNGARIAREGWNGKNMFVFLFKGEIKAGPPNKSFDPEIIKWFYENNQNVNLLPSLCMYTATQEILIGWLASQTDMLANDWQILE